MKAGKQQVFFGIPAAFAPRFFFLVEDRVFWYNTFLELCFQ
jgi:hypothetical protein